MRTGLNVQMKGIQKTAVKLKRQESASAQTHDRRRSFEGLERLTKEVEVLTRPVLGKRGFTGLEIIENWESIIGSDLALGICPEKLTFEKQERANGTLHVKSAGGAFALLFEHHKQQVIDRINSFFGYPAVASIKIIQGKLSLDTPVSSMPFQYVPTHSEKAILKGKARLIDNAKLRKSFYRAGLAFLKRQHK